MQNLVPRLIGESEAKRLGIQDGWYGTKVSGTIMTGASSSLENCMAAIDGVPEPAAFVDLTPGTISPSKVPTAKAENVLFNMQARTAYQIGRKSSRHIR